MRNYRRLAWIGHAPNAFLLSVCPDCGAVVENKGTHDAWHDDEMRDEP